MTREEKRLLRPLLRRIGMPYVAKREGYEQEEWFGWDGRALTLEADVSDALHEVAHWLLAVPKRRALPDFGLADDERLWRLRHDDRPRARRFVKAWLPWGTQDDEEHLASLLGILLERALGRPWRDTWRQHRWDQEDHRPGKGWGYRAFFRQLQRAGLLVGLTPTCLGKTPRRRKVAQKRILVFRGAKQTHAMGTEESCRST